MRELLQTIRRLDLVLLLSLRRIYLGGFQVIGLREMIYAFAGFHAALKLRSVKGFNVALWFFTFATILVVGLSSFWGRSLSFSEGLENIYFFVVLTTLCFTSIALRGAVRDFELGVMIAFLYVFFRHYVLGDRTGGLYLGYYGWPNSTWLVPAVLSYALYSLYAKTRSRVMPLLLGALAAAVLISDSQRGGFVNLFFVTTIVVFLMRKDILLGPVRTSMLIGCLAGLSFLMLIHDERSQGGFFLSIIRPLEYSDNYSSGVSRLNQITAAIEVWTESVETILLGVGPFENIIYEAWNDVHMGYVSFLARYGVIAFAFLVACLWSSFKFCAMAIRQKRARLVHFLFLTLIADALTQTTFDSVPTAAITFMVLAYCSQGLFMRNTEEVPPVRAQPYGGAPPT